MQKASRATIVALLVSIASASEPTAKKCGAGSEKYWALDKPNNECAESCLATEVQKVEFWILTGGQGAPAGNISTPCADHGFRTFNRTDVLGFGKLRIDLDKYLPDPRLHTPPSPVQNKCALDCTLKAIGVYWACAAVCIEKQAPDSCITAGCLATVTAYDVPCLKGCKNTTDIPVPAVQTQVSSSSEPCCNKKCQAPLEKYFSTDAPHGFCGEACMDPKKFDTYHKFEANLTKATTEHPCSAQWTPSNTKRYTDYYQTVTHGFPGILTVTLDLYAPSDMPDHSCCSTPLFSSLNCFGIPGKPQSMTISGTGPYCCPATATETTPCPAALMV